MTFKIWKILLILYIFTHTCDLYTFDVIRSTEEYCAKDGRLRKCNFSDPFRTFDGSCNNRKHPSLGTLYTPFRRILKPLYDDGVNKPRQKSKSGNLLPNARTIAMKIHYPNDMPSKFTNYLVHFTQFIGHDITLTGESKLPEQNRTCLCSSNANDVNEECIPILIPEDDLINKDQSCFEEFRSMSVSPHAQQIMCNYSKSVFYREQLNGNTHWLDLSQMYDVTTSRNKEFRLFNGGLLNSTSLTSFHQHYLPFKPPNTCPITSKSPCFLTGDMRINSNSLLVSLHTVFLREHNRIARLLSQFNWTDEKTFQIARKITNGIYQHIIYNEWLPTVIGTQLAHQYNLIPLKEDFLYGYESELRAAVFNEFSTAAYRFGHALVRSSFKTADIDYHTIINAVMLKDVIFNTSSMFSPDSTIDHYLRGSLIEDALKYGPHVNDQLNNHLFEDVVTSDGFVNKRDSLAALDVNRGRDHGLPGYNNYREICGLGRAKNFEDLNDLIPANRIEILKAVYEHVDDIDLFTGALNEEPVKSGLVGPTNACIIAKQFRDLKYGDRFYYENGMDSSTKFDRLHLKEIKKASMARLLCDNVKITEIQLNPFLLVDSENNKLVKCSKIDGLSIDVWRFS